VAAEAEQVERKSRKDLVTGPDPRFLCPSDITSCNVWTASATISITREAAK